MKLCLFLNHVVPITYEMFLQKLIKKLFFFIYIVHEKKNYNCTEVRKTYLPVPIEIQLTIR